MDAAVRAFLIATVAVTALVAGCTTEPGDRPQPPTDVEQNPPPVSDPGRGDPSASEEDTGTSGDGQTDPRPVHDVDR